MDYIESTQYQTSEIRNPKSEIQISLIFFISKIKTQKIGNIKCKID